MVIPQFRKLHIPVITVLPIDFMNSYFFISTIPNIKKTIILIMINININQLLETIKLINKINVLHIPIPKMIPIVPYILICDVNIVLRIKMRKPIFSINNYNMTMSLREQRMGVKSIRKASGREFIIRELDLVQ